jgi:1-acyl-sn-glycerol-3-phosphate acyltransferase
MSVDTRVVELIREISGNEIATDDPIALDSLGHAELALAVEDEFGVWLPDGTAATTPREVAEAIQDRLGETARTTPLRPGIGSLQLLGEAVLEPLLDHYYRLEVVGVGHVPARGPVILASNHDSFVDIPLMGRACPRPVSFMAKEELFRTGFGRWFFHVLGGFPVGRERNDLGSIRAGLDVLRWGRVLGMYPEGTRSTRYLPFLAGTAWMALAAGAPIVPLRMIGTRESMPPGALWPRRSQVRIVFGETIDPGRESNPRARLARAREVTDELRDAIARLG